VFAPWLAALVLGLGMLLEWHSWHYGLYGLAFALVLCVALARERDGVASVIDRYFARLGVYSYSLYLLPRDPARLRNAPRECLTV